MSELPDIDALAGEYVLGTLDATERIAVAARLQREPALAQAVENWQRRLAPLDAAVAPVTPPAALWNQIATRIAQPTGSASAGVSRLQRSVRRWRAATVAASAIAASLLMVMTYREYSRSLMPQNFVAIFQKDDASPSFVMSVDLATKTLSVRRVAATVPEGKTYQLWIAADQLGPGPQSLGLVEGQLTQVRAAIQNIDPAVVQTALFGVSLEPTGGSPTGKPTGPVFHAKLIPTTP